MSKQTKKLIIWIFIGIITGAIIGFALNLLLIWTVFGAIYGFLLGKLLTRRQNPS